MRDVVVLILRHYARRKGSQQRHHVRRGGHLGDFLARDRSMANAMPGDYLAVCTAGAYGFVLSSNYNSRPRAPEVLVDGATWRIIRQREQYQDLVRGETL